MGCGSIGGVRHEAARLPHRGFVVRDGGGAAVSLVCVVDGGVSVLHAVEV